MTKPLEDLLRAAAKSGSLNHISIAYLHSGGWAVAYRGTLHADHRMVEGPDVVDCLIDALTGRKSAPDGKRVPAKVAAKPVRQTRQAAKPTPMAAPMEDDVLGDLM